MKVAIIKYNAGNTRSVQYALQRIGCSSLITDDPETITDADKVIFPGVGQAGAAMEYLKGKRLDKLIPSLTQPFLGICLGMQLLCNYSEEDETTCMRVFNTTVKKFHGKGKIPHVGWNEVRTSKQNYYAYYVHSYYAELCDETTSITKHIQLFSAALRKDNFYGVQFHPEKSAAAGEQLLKNFLAL